MESVIEISKSESSISKQLERELRSNKNKSKIKLELQGVSVFNEEDLPKIFGSLRQQVPKSKLDS